MLVSAILVSSRTQLITQNSGLQALSSKESAKNQCVINSVQLLIPVWSLVCDRRLGASDAIILESFPNRTATDLINAWADDNASPDEIEQTIIKND